MRNTAAAIRINPRLAAAVFALAVLIVIGGIAGKARADDGSASATVFATVVVNKDVLQEAKPPIAAPEKPVEARKPVKAVEVAPEAKVVRFEVGKKLTKEQKDLLERLKNEGI